MRELIGGGRRPNVAVVMAGGQGSRLRPLTEHVPKPMLAVAGRPILERIILHLVGSGISQIFVAVNYRADVIEAHFHRGERFGCRIDYLREEPDSPLGTAGALTLLPPGAAGGEAVLVMNGDLVTEFRVGPLLEHHASSGALITVGLRPYAHQVPYGVVETAAGRINRIEEKPVPVWDVNAGVYALDPAVLDRIPAGQAITMPDLIAESIQQGDLVVGHTLDGDWIDVGQLDELRRARGVQS
jgi:NDP-sugar pyrophosphorylase family protein